MPEDGPWSDKGNSLHYPFQFTFFSIELADPKHQKTKHLRWDKGLWIQRTDQGTSEQGLNVLVAAGRCRSYLPWGRGGKRQERGRGEEERIDGDWVKISYKKHKVRKRGFICIKTRSKKSPEPNYAKIEAKLRIATFCDWFRIKLLRLFDAVWWWWGVYVCVCVLENSEQHARNQIEPQGVRDAGGKSRVPFFFLFRSSNQTRAAPCSALQELRD